MAVVSVRLSDDEKNLLDKMAKFMGVTLSDLLKTSTMEKIEDEYDIETFNLAKKEFEKDSTVYSLNEVKEELGLE